MPKRVTAKRAAKRAAKRFTGQPIAHVFERPIMIHICRDGTLTYRDRGPERWYVFVGFTGQLEDLDRVTSELATFWADYIDKSLEAQVWAKKLKAKLRPRHIERSGSLAEPSDKAGV